MKAIPFAATGRNARIVRQPVQRSAFRHRLRTTLNPVFTMLRNWRRRSRERAELARLDERMLRDIGVTRADVWREINKPFWRS